MTLTCEGLDADQRARVGAYWWRRAEGELTSWVGFQHVLADLRNEGSPAAVVELAERAVTDEYQHAVFCSEWAARFGHPVGELRPRSERAATFVGATDAENRLLRITLCCFTETVGCFILQHVRPVVTDSDLRHLNRRHLADELQHSRVGWGHLASLDEARKTFLRGRIPGLLRLLPGICCDGPEEDYEDLIPFGYFTPRLLRAAQDEALREVILPGLRHMGLT